MALLIALSVVFLIQATAGQIFGVTPTSFSCQSLFNFYPHETDCSRFYRCFWGQAHEFVCPSNTKWNQRILTCDHGYNVPCVTAIVAKPVFQDWQTSVGIGGGSGININNVGGFRVKPAGAVDFVKETIGRPSSIVGPHMIPTRQYPAYDTPTPSIRQRPTMGAEYARQDEFSFSGQNTGFPGPNVGYSGPNAGFSGPNTGFSAQNGGNGYLYNFVNQPYRRKSMWYASAGSPDPRYVRSKTTKWDLGFGSNTQFPRPNIKFVKVRDPVVGRYFGRKAWKK